MVTRYATLVASGALTDLRGTRAGVARRWPLSSFGATVGIVVASPGTDRRAAALAGVASLMWMAIRWLAMRWAAPRLVAEDPAALRGAFALGLLAYALALTPELRLAAWLSQPVPSRAWCSCESGGSAARSSRAVGFAWGMQALVVAGGWLARNAYIAILAARG